MGTRNAALLSWVVVCGCHGATSDPPSNDLPSNEQEQRAIAALQETVEADEPGPTQGSSDVPSGRGEPERALASVAEVAAAADSLLCCAIHGLGSQRAGDLTNDLAQIRDRPEVTVRVVRAAFPNVEALLDPEEENRAGRAIGVLAHLEHRAGYAVLAEWYEALSARGAPGLPSEQRFAYLMLDGLGTHYAPEVVRGILRRWGHMSETERVLTGAYVVRAAEGRRDVVELAEERLGEATDPSSRRMLTRIVAAMNTSSAP